VALALSAPGCRRDAPAGASGRVKVVVSIPPQAYFVERIAGDRADVRVLVGPGQSPHTFEPTAKQMAGVLAADVYLRIGVPFEDALCGKIAAMGGGVRIVDTRRGIELHRVEAHGEGRPEQHPDEHGHDADELDPHVWLSPRLAKVQARTICDELCAIDPAGATLFGENLRSLEADLDRLDAEIAESLAPVRGRTFFAFHPAFGYFAEAYGLKQRAVEMGGKSPGARHIKRLIEQAKAEGVKVIFVQPQFSQSAAEAIADQIGGAVVPLDPLARDYLSNLRDMARKIHGALGGD